MTNKDTLNSATLLSDTQSTQNFANMTNSTISVNVIDTDLENKIPRRRSSVSINRLAATHYEHRVSMPFSNNTAFKKGNVVRGILCPSMTNSFRFVVLLICFIETLQK